MSDPRGASATKSMIGSVISAALVGWWLAWGCLVLGGGGHGTLLPSLILFPSSVVAAWLTNGDVSWVYSLALAQFPAYVGGAVLADYRGWIQRRRAVLSILLIHGLALVIALGMMPFYYG